MWRRILVVFDRPIAIDFSLSLHSSSLRGCPTKFARVCSSGLVLNTAHLLVLMVGLKSWFTNCMHSMTLIDRTGAKSPRTGILCATTLSLLSRRQSTSSRVSPLMLFSCAACASLFAGQREEDFSFFLRQPDKAAFQDPRPTNPILSPGFLFFQMNTLLTHQL
jgi:hypothetical protein